MGLKSYTAINIRAILPGLRGMVQAEPARKPASRGVNRQGQEGTAPLAGRRSSRSR